MLSPAHEILVELFRNRGELVGELLHELFGLELGEVTAKIVSADFTQVVPAEYRADAAIVFYDREDEAVLTVIVEVQLKVDPDKEWTWPLYVCAARARYRCPTLLMVISPSEPVALWARTAISIDPHGSQMLPLALSYRDVPEIIDPVTAQRSPELAVLSALAHHTLPIAEAALAGISALPEDTFQLYYDAILDALPELDRRKLKEAYMQGFQYKSQFGRAAVAHGRVEGRQEGRVEGRRSAVLDLARAKLELLSADEEAAILAIVDDAVLTDLIVELGRARDGEQARAVLDRAIPRRS